MGIDRFDGKEIEYLQEVLASGRLSGGQYARRLEEAFAEAYGVKHAIVANSAMSLLISAWYAAGAGVGDEVICDPLVQFHAIAALWQNAYTVWADGQLRPLATREALPESEALAARQHHTTHQGRLRH